MTDHAYGRGARLMAAPLVATALLTACSGGGTTPATATQPAAATGQPSATTTLDAAAAAAALQRAEATVGTTRSFSFDATEVLSGDTTHATRVRGSVVRAQGVSYVLTANGRTTQVIRIKGATYVRQVPGVWRRLRTPLAVTDPVGSLLAILRGTTRLSGHQDSGGGVTVKGQLTASAAAAAQVPTTAGHPATVEITIDAAGHVTRLIVTTTARGGATAVTLTTSYGGFDAIQPLRAPV